MLRKNKIKELEKKVAAVNKELKELRAEDKSCHECQTKKNCMHGPSDDASSTCHNTSCPSYDSKWHFNCKKYNSVAHDRSYVGKHRECCGFTRKNMSCNCNMRCCC